ncbi:MAG: hypothetical protein QM805_13100 [Pseudomonas sp.]
MAQHPPPASAADIDATKSSTLRIFLVRMLVFLILCALIVAVLYRQIWTAFLANPRSQRIDRRGAAHRHHPRFPEQVLQALSGSLMGQQFPGVRSRRSRSIAGRACWRRWRPSLPTDRAAWPFHSRPCGICWISIATRLDEARDLSRYMTGLLVFLGLLGTFWGLIETVGSVGKVIEGLKAGGEAGAVFDTLKEGLAAPLGGMGISFSSSLFGLAGSLILGFLDLQSSQAQTASTPTLRTGLPRP